MAFSPLAPSNPVVNPIGSVTVPAVVAPLSNQQLCVRGCLPARGEQCRQLVVPGVDASVAGVPLDASGAFLVPLVPLDEDCPLLSLQRDQLLVRQPHEVLVRGNGEVDVVALEVVRHSTNANKPPTGTVVPVQLGVYVLEPVGGHADRTWEKRIRELVRPDVLILDDFAMRQLSAAQADDLYELVSERQGRSLIITSNRAPSDWYPLFPNPVVAESLLDRLINTSHQVIMNGPSYRPNKRPRTSTAGAAKTD